MCTRPDLESAPPVNPFPDDIASTMSTAMLKTVLLATILATSHAFVPVDIQPIPSDLDTNKWSAVTTLTDAILPTAPSTPTPDIQILPVLDANIVPELKRQVTGQGAAATTTAVTQVSPVTTYYANSYINGVATRVAVVYTQTFAAIPDQWPTYTAGEIGLGTLTGTIGVVKTKRSLPTQIPLAGDALETPADEDGDNGLFHWIMKKLAGTAEEEQEKETRPMIEQHRNYKDTTTMAGASTGAAPSTKAGTIVMLAAVLATICATL